MRDTPLLKNGIAHLLHTFRAPFRNGVSGEIPLPCAYSKMIGGGMIRLTGGRGLPDTPPPPCRGGLHKIKSNGRGGMAETPLPPISSRIPTCIS